MSGTPYTPTVHVEFAFGFSPMVDTTDGSFVEPAAVYPTQVIIDEVQIGRGRPSEFDNFPPGTCQINIIDRNRIFDPQNTAGPYYGQLKPRVPVRVRGKIGATYYPRFYGYVDGWPMYSDRYESTVNIVATDGFKILQGIVLPSSMYEVEVLDDSPTAYWKLGEATGTRAADYSGNRHDGTYLNAKQGQPTVAPYGGDGSMGGNQLEYQGVVVTDENAKVGDGTNGSFSVEMWIRSDGERSDVDGLLGFGERHGLYRQGAGGSYGYGFAVAVMARKLVQSTDWAAYTNFTEVDQVTNLIRVSLVSAPTGVKYWSAPTVLDGTPHHIVFTATVTGGTLTAYELYYDGEPGVLEQVGDTAAFVESDSSSEIFIGNGPSVQEELSFVGEIDEVAVYPTALSAATVAEHYEAGVAPSDGEVTGARITRILDIVGWPAAARSIDNGEHTLGPAVIGGQTALQHLQTVAASEQGRLFMSRDGKVTFHARDRFITESTESTSQFTFSDDGAGDAIYGGAQFIYDERYLYNRAVITRVGGSPVTVDSTSSQADYGPLTRSLDGLLLRDEGQARSIGEYLVYRYNEPQVRAESWELQPEVDATSFADVFDLEIGHRVTVENKPSNKGTQFALDLHVEQVTETIVPRAWGIAYRGSPADPNSATYFRWGGVGATQGWGTGYWR